MSSCFVYDEVQAYAAVQDGEVILDSTTLCERGQDLQESPSHSLSSVPRILVNKPRQLLGHLVLFITG